MAGLPPLSGFVGKLLILDAAFNTPYMVLIWAVVLGASLISVVGFARAGSLLFWKAKSIDTPDDASNTSHPSSLSYIAVGGLLVLLMSHTIFAGAATTYTTAIANQLFTPNAYLTTVLTTRGKMSNAKAEGNH